MIQEIAGSLNWSDIFFIILLIAICYINFAKGLISAIFKFFGVLFASFISINYYSYIAQGLERFIPTNISLLNFLSFFILTAICISISELMLFGFNKLFNLQAISTLERWGGLLFGLLQGILIFGLFVLSLNLLEIDFLKNSFKNSYFSHKVVTMQLKAYERVWNSIVVKLLPEEKTNYSLFDFYEIK